ncbi:hypothetical protein [Alicyclobacillus vulcanalis]|uniref:Uncharacterized protein n=1 Tax=Alicyclobacillus vulcanalis TaxID=252246 RepID=A0A1N7MYA4_9BACL|nr:hypothetical protein [Alicyclobacillus vulcanalis]SIS91093.1 hypothetical protein SAMN05421799_106217 [Alicyclobacillus vulcanalis]
MVMKPELTKYARDLEIQQALKRMDREGERGPSKDVRKWTDRVQL